MKPKKNFRHSDLFIKKALASGSILSENNIPKLDSKYGQLTEYLVRKLGKTFLPMSDTLTKEIKKYWYQK